MAETDEGVLQAPAGPNASERRREIDRAIGLSDGVFAFALTLLVTTIDVPRLTDAEASTELAGKVFGLWPQILAYGIGFLVIATAWRAHRRIFSRVRDYDDFLMWVNVILLMLIAFQPFPTGLLGQYGEAEFAAMFYAASIAPVALVFVLILDHLDDNRQLVTRDGQNFDFEQAKARHLITAFVFLVSIPIATVATGLAQASWAILIFDHWLARRICRRLPRFLQSRNGQS